MHCDIISFLDGSRVGTGTRSEKLIYKQVVPGADVKKNFQWCGASGRMALHWAPPARLRGDMGHFVVREVWGLPNAGPLELLSLVAFGGLKGCLEDGRSPTRNTCAHFVEAVQVASTGR